MNTAMDEKLPREIILEILWRFPTKFVGKSRLLSKELSQATQNSYFKNLHAHRSGTIHGFLLQGIIQSIPVFVFVSADHRTFDFSLDFLPGREPRILAAAPHGLLFCQTRNPNPRRHNIPMFYVCKPLIQQWKPLPNPKTRYFNLHTAMTVHGSNPLRFKLVRVSEAKPSPELIPKFSRFILEIFNSETWRWKQLDDVKLPVSTFFLFDAAVSASGAVHWEISDDRIFGIRLDDEVSWYTFDIPDEIHGDNGSGVRVRTLTEYEGKLAFMYMKDYRDSFMDVWVMEDYEKKVWCKKLRISNKGLKVGNYIKPIGFHGSDIAVMSEGWKLKYHKYMNDSYEEKDVGLFYYDKIFPFWSDYEDCNFVRRFEGLGSSLGNEEDDKLKQQET